VCPGSVGVRRELIHPPTCKGANTKLFCLFEDKSFKYFNCIMYLKDESGVNTYRLGFFSSVKCFD